MKKQLIKTCLLFCFVSLTGQTSLFSQVVIEGGIFLRMANTTSSDSLFLVVGNPAPSAITGATSGGIIVDSQKSLVRWLTGSSNQSGYLVPFVKDQTGAKVPLSFDITTAGSAAGYIDCGTYPTNTGNLPLPAGVTQLNNTVFTPDVTGNKVYDRFWIANRRNYVTQLPALSMGLGYLTAEFSGGIASTARMAAQTYSNSSSTWQGPLGTDDLAGTVSQITVSSGNNNRYFTLIEAQNGWTGAVSNVWTNAGNWSNGVVPNSTQEALILSSATNMPVISGLNPEVGSLTVQNGATLTIAGSSALTVNGLLTNNGQITVQNNGALVQAVGSNLAGTGTFSVARTLPTADRFHYIGSPVTNVAVNAFGIVPSVFNGSDGSQLVPQSSCDPLSLEAGSPWANLLELRENATVLSNCSQSLWHVKSAGNLTNGRGYAAMAYGASTTSLQFNGTVNNGTVSYSGLGNSNGIMTDPLSGTITRGWHLVSNPYPSPITFGTNNADLTSMNFDAQVQVWNAAANTWSPSVSNAILPVGQGFQIRNSSVSSSLTFQTTNALRTATSSTFLSSPWDQFLTINLESGNQSMPTIIFFHEEATDQYDGKFEANRLFGGAEVPVIYTKINDSEKMAFNGYSPNFTGTKTVPMGVYDGMNPGNFSLRFQDLITLQNMVVTLEDTKLNVFQNVQEGFEYSFTTESGDIQDRFKVHFNLIDNSGIDNQNTGVFQIFPNPAEDNIQITFSDAKSAYSIQLYDVNGKRLSAREIPSGTQTVNFSLETFAPGMYMMDVISEEGVRNVKKFIRK
jgi:hypothetical protein